MSSKNKQSFLHYEIWILSFGGAFQRSGVYSTTSETERTKFRKELRTYIEDTILPQYKNAVSEEQHIANLLNIVEYSTKFKNILNNGKLNLGISQKLLNLVLKYLWCLGEIKTPPHFPVDRIIQQKIKNKPLINWTGITQIEEYLKIIRLAEVLAKKEKMSLAQWELESFSRR
jgi:hypothetical protein